MTIKQLYEKAVGLGVENLPLAIQYEDAGGVYDGDTFEDWLDVDLEIRSRNCFYKGKKLKDINYAALYSCLPDDPTWGGIVEEHDD